MHFKVLYLNTLELGPPKWLIVSGFFKFKEQTYFLNLCFLSVLLWFSGLTLWLPAIVAGAPVSSFSIAWVHRNGKVETRMLLIFLRWRVNSEIDWLLLFGIGFKGLMSIDFGLIGGSQPLMDLNFRGNFLRAASIVKSGWVSCLYVA